MTDHSFVPDYVLVNMVEHAQEMRRQWMSSYTEHAAGIERAQRSLDYWQEQEVELRLERARRAADLTNGGDHD